MYSCSRETSIEDNIPLQQSKPGLAAGLSLRFFSPSLSSLSFFFFFIKLMLFFKEIEQIEIIFFSENINYRVVVFHRKQL